MASGLEGVARGAVREAREEQREHTRASMWLAVVVATAVALLGTVVVFFVAIAGLDKKFAVPSSTPRPTHMDPRLAIVEANATGSVLVVRRTRDGRPVRLERLVAEAPRIDILGYPLGGDPRFDAAPLSVTQRATFHRRGDSFWVTRHDGAVRRFVWDARERTCPGAGGTQGGFLFCHADHLDRCALSPMPQLCGASTISFVELALIGDTVWVVAERGPGQVVLAGVPFDVED